MRTLKLIAATAVAMALPQAAHAVDITFVNGNYNVSGPQVAAPAQDLFTDYNFTAAAGDVFSGSLTTTRLRIPAGTGPIISDLDFDDAVLLFGSNVVATFAAPLGNTDVTELLALASTTLTNSGLYTLRVNYDVVAARPRNAASFGGTLNLGSAAAVVPEPAMWATMLAGFGLVGIGMRRRRTIRATLA